MTEKTTGSGQPEGEDCGPEPRPGPTPPPDASASGDNPGPGPSERGVEESDARPESPPAPPLPPDTVGGESDGEDSSGTGPGGQPPGGLFRVCRNCGHHESRAECLYCAQCGEHLVRNRPLPIHVFFKQIAEEAWDFDNKVSRTMRLLLFKPGQLTLEYSAGRRARYTRPARMYVFLSAIYFLLFSIVNPFGVDFGQEFTAGMRTGLESGQSGKGLAEFSGELGQSAGRQLAGATGLGEGDADQAVETIGSGDPVAEANGGDAATTDSLQLADKVRRDLEETTSPMKRAFLERVLLAVERIEVLESGDDGGATQQVVGERMQESMQKWLPVYSLLSMVLIALVLKLLYLDSAYYLAEHLIFATHYTLFTFTLGILMIPFIALGWSQIQVIAPVASLVYFAVAQWRFYREPAGMAFLRITAMLLIQCCLYCSLGMMMGIIAGIEALFF